MPFSTVSTRLVMLPIWLSTEYVTLAMELCSSLYWSRMVRSSPRRLVRTTSSTTPAAAPANQGQLRFFGGCWAAR